MLKPYFFMRIGLRNIKKFKKISSGLISLFNIYLTCGSISIDTGNLKTLMTIKNLIKPSSSKETLSTIKNSETEKIKERELSIAFIDAIKKDNVEAVKKLISAGVNINTTNENKQNGLIIAINEIKRNLSAINDAINQAEKYGYESPTERVRLIQLLLDSNIDINLTDRFGKKAIDYASEKFLDYIVVMIEQKLKDLSNIQQRHNEIISELTKKIGSSDIAKITASYLDPAADYKEAVHNQNISSACSQKKPDIKKNTTKSKTRCIVS